eukprot:TRINITY_DN64681_c0_g1_i1.p1 TRINITY_DN64681_c0_g1~~TRINITY_DN64681_c0_g1_i1.p1  ORF type:complete len:380 (-),score=66.63 TRINITY_DN64681_c0_g1_i1:92-1198(-)
MAVACRSLTALVCLAHLSRAGSVSEDLEKERIRCMRPASQAPARRPGDLKQILGPLSAGESFSELGPKVLSTDPLVVYFEQFLSEEEVAQLERHLFDARDFAPSPAGGLDKKMAQRHSETAFCTGECDEHTVVQRARQRASDITGVPVENFDFSQALRYRQGMFYREHHDNHPTFHYLPCGTRVFTYFVYLSDEGLEGGATFFSKLNITAPAKRGAAVLFANTKDRNPMETDLRTMHESLTVTKGEKRGMNMWLYQYNFRSPWSRGCTNIELADELSKYGKAASVAQPKVNFQSHSKKKFYIFDVRDRGPEVFVDAVEPEGSSTVHVAEGNVLHVKDKEKHGKKVAEYSVKGKSSQTVHLGKKRNSEL